MKPDVEAMTLTLHPALASAAGAGPVAFAVPAEQREVRRAPSGRSRRSYHDRHDRGPRHSGGTLPAQAVQIPVPSVLPPVHTPTVSPRRRLAVPASLLRAQRWTGISLTATSWLLLLLGLAYLVMAALYNRDEELGLGIDATRRGAWLCLCALLLAALGIPAWVLAERRLRPQA